MTPAERAARVTPFLNQYARDHEGWDPGVREIAIDFLADFMHWADLVGVDDWPSIARVAAMHHSAEKDEAS